MSYTTLKPLSSCRLNRTSDNGPRMQIYTHFSEPQNFFIHNFITHPHRTLSTPSLPLLYPLSTVTLHPNITPSTHKHITPPTQSLEAPKSQSLVDSLSRSLVVSKSKSLVVSKSRCLEVPKSQPLSKTTASPPASGRAPAPQGAGHEYLSALSVLRPAPLSYRRAVSWRACAL